MVTVDWLTKLAHIAPIKTDRELNAEKMLDTKQAARLNLEHVFTLHGAPDNLVSDRGRQVIPERGKTILSFLQIKYHVSTVHYPETDGHTE